MSSIREQIIEFVAGVSNDGAPTTGGVLNNVAGTGGVFRSRQAAMAKSEGTVLLVQPKDEKVENRNSCVAIRDVVLDIRLLLRSDTPDATADPFMILIHAQLFADQTLGGLANRIIEEGTEWEYAEADTIGAEVSLLYRIRYMTPVNSLSTLA